MRQKYMISIVALGLLLLVMPVGLAVAAPPATPTNFTATITAGTTSNTVTLKWTAAPTAGSYTIQRIDWASGKKAFGVRGGTTTSLVQTGLAKGSTYRFRIRANSAAGFSAWSPILEVKTP